MTSLRALALAAIGLVGCAQNGSSGATNAPLPPVVPTTQPKIDHVVIIFQENRSVDNLFNGFRGADTVRSGTNSKGETVALRAVPLTSAYDVTHEHAAFTVERANGRLNGFDRVLSSCEPNRSCPPARVRAYAYVARRDVEPYFEMASRYAFADHLFQSNEGPSFPAHQYIISGTSTIANGSPLRAAGNPFSPTGGVGGGCDSKPGTIVWLIDPLGNENQATYPCFERLTLMDLLEAKSLTWRYYQAHPGAGLWEAPDAIRHIRRSNGFSTRVLSPPKIVLTDIAARRLANVVWVTPTAAASDHAGITDGSGPSWVASVVNAIGESPYWKSTAIFVTWDDWGGWYDHVPPPQYNSYELGFRVPLIVISPYAKAHFVSHRRHEFGSILRFVEETLGLDSMHTTDTRSDDLSDCFDFSQAPIPFHPIEARLPASYFLKQPMSMQDPDDE